MHNSIEIIRYHRLRVCLVATYEQINYFIFFSYEKKFLTPIALYFKLIYAKASHKLRNPASTKQATDTQITPPYIYTIIIYSFSPVPSPSP